MEAPTTYCGHCRGSREDHAGSRRCRCIPDRVWEVPEIAAAVLAGDAAAVIRNLRHHPDTKLSQTALANMTGLSQATISRASNGIPIKDQRKERQALAGLGANTIRPPALTSARTAASAKMPQVMPLASEVDDRLEIASIDRGLIEIFEQQTQNLRMIDRKLGARYLFAQSQAHVQQMHELLHQALPGPLRRGLARALAEAASLTAWQALDSGRAQAAWKYYELAKAAARESEDIVILTHVSAEQVYTLLDSGREREALSVLTGTRLDANSKVPALLRAWLSAVSAEVHATVGDGDATRTSMDRAFALLPQDPDDSELPFLMLDTAHLLRWRGNCLARLGDAEAIVDLQSALEGIAPLELGRAEASLRTDLAWAYSTRGEEVQAKLETERALELSHRSGSARQIRRLQRLMVTDRE